MELKISLETPEYFIEAKGWYVERENSCDGRVWNQWERTSFQITLVEDMECNELPPSSHDMIIALHGNEVLTLLDDAADEVTESDEPEYDHIDTDR